MSNRNAMQPMQPRHPFDEPFFRDPFQMMGSMMQQMDAMMGSFNDPFFSEMHRGMPMQQHQQQPVRNSNISRPRIEEVHDDEPSPGLTNSRPIVQEPDGECS